MTTHRLLFVRRGDFPSPIVNRLRDILLRDAHRGHRHALGANGDPLQDLGGISSQSRIAAELERKTWITIIDSLLVEMIGKVKKLTKIHLSIGITRTLRVTR
ncbi:MAG: hypothetical protein ACJAVK_000787 [Akkermansiaceae bacterium]